MEYLDMDQVQVLNAIGMLNEESGKDEPVAISTVHGRVLMNGYEINDWNFRKAINNLISNGFLYTYQAIDNRVYITGAGLPPGAIEGMLVGEELSKKDRKRAELLARRASRKFLQAKYKDEYEALIKKFEEENKK